MVTIRTRERNDGDNDCCGYPELSHIVVALELGSHKRAAENARKGGVGNGRSGPVVKIIA
jgi:hypothetical protein